MSRYIIADPDTGNGWGHIFGSREGERDVRFVFDKEDNKLVSAEIMINNWFSPATPEEIADLEDSLINANPESLDPETTDLIVSDDLPEWALPAAAPKP